MRFAHFTLMRAKERASAEALNAMRLRRKVAKQIALSCTTRFIRVASLKVLRRELIRNISSSAACVVQTTYRGWKVRMDLVTMQRGALIVQRHRRGVLGRRRATVLAMVQRYERQNLEKRYACVKSIQRWFRWRLREREARRSVVIIQSLARAHLSRTCVANILAKSAAATALQAFARMCVARMTFLQSSWSVRTMQRVFRGRRGRMRAAEALSLLQSRTLRDAIVRAQIDAAAKIQAAWRTWRVKIAVRASASVAMQRLWRGTLGKLVIRSRRRKRVLILTRRLWEARNIFGSSRGRKGTRTSKHVRARATLRRDALFSQNARVLLHNSCATKIARIVRSFLSSKKMSRELEAVVTLQCAYRSYVARVRLHDALLRSFIAKTRLRNRWMKATRIQAMWRGIKLQGTFHRLKTAAVLCQALRRTSIQRKRYLALWKATIFMQSRWRATLAKRRANAIRARRARELSRLDTLRNNKNRKWNFPRTFFLQYSILNMISKLTEN